MPRSIGKKFYRRKRFWILLLFILPVLAITPFVIRAPLKVFYQSVSFLLNRWGIEERSLQAGKYRFHLYEGGKNNTQTVILLHGFGGNALFSWMELMPSLSKKYHVIAPDLLASNFLRLDPKNYSVDSEVELVLQMMAALQIPHASFVGLSVGGWISMIIALEHPQLVDRLILVESAGVKMEVPELAHLILTDRETAKHFMNLLFYSPPPLPGFVLDQLIKSSLRIKSKYEAVFMGFIQNSQDRLLDDRVRGITQPTLIIHGREDKVIPLEVGERLHQLIPHSEMIVLEKSGHGAVWDSPWKLKNAILDFLSRPPSPQT
jgi:pimeloyl-ACP methyl ester carboxylesterase